MPCLHEAHGWHMGSPKNPIHVQMQKLRPRRRKGQGRGTRRAAEPGAGQLSRSLQLAQQLLLSASKHERPGPLFTESTQFITELHFHLHTDYFRAGTRVGVGQGRDRCPSEARSPGARVPRPGQGRGGSIRPPISGHQLSTCTRTASQQLLTHKYRHA